MSKSRAIKREQWSVGQVTFEPPEDTNRGNATKALTPEHSPTFPHNSLFTCACHNFILNQPHHHTLASHPPHQTNQPNHQ